MADPDISDWFVERGIGENRALLTIDGQICGARLHWPGELFAGQSVKATLASKTAGSRRGTALIATGQEVLVDHLPPDLSEGEQAVLTITRAAIAEKRRSKHAQGRYVSGDQVDDAEWLNDAQNTREFASGCWEDIWHAASSGEVNFAGGSLSFSVTPGMTVIDVDGDGSARELSLAAVPYIARWLALFDLGGNIGIDFPTIEAKVDRRAVDQALESALENWPHERTAMNGFGFVQLVARMGGPSLLHRFATSRVGMCARYAVRVAERVEGIGPILLLRVHPALKAKIKTDWIEELARRTGREVRIETDPGLALEAPQAQILGS